MVFLNFISTAAELGSGTDVTTAGSFDSTYCAGSIKLDNNTSGGSFGPGADATETDLWFHFDIYGDNDAMDGNNADGGVFFVLLDSDQSFYADLSNGSISLGTTSSGGVSVSNASSLVPVQWALVRATVDIHVEINNAGNDICTMYVNGVEIHQSTISNATTGATKCKGITFNNNDMDGNIYLSQIMVANEDTRGLKLCVMEPNAAGDNAAWIGDYTNVIDHDGTYISSNTAAQREDWNLEAYPGPASPTGIRLFQKGVATKGATGPSGIQHYLRISSTNYNGATHANPNLANPVITEWAINPATAAAWATADLASLIAGVESIT